MNLTRDPIILSWIRGYRIPFSSTVFQTKCPVEKSWSPKEVETISNMILELERKGVISECTPFNDQYVSNIFLTPKSNGGFRLILNLKSLNKFVDTEHFKLEDWRTAVKLLSQGCFMCTIDL